ncbi:unnamed protein product [Sphagnum balticum]
MSYNRYQQQQQNASPWASGAPPNMYGQPPCWPPQQSMYGAPSGIWSPTGPSGPSTPWTASPKRQQTTGGWNSYGGSPLGGGSNYGTSMQSK